jgi:hypothetical protein
MITRHVVLSVALVAGLASTATAQITEAEARKQFKAALADAQAELKASLAETKAVFIDELEIFEELVKQGNYDLPAVEDLFTDVQELMGNIGQAVRSVGNDISLAASDALGALANGADLDGLFPDDFYPGDGGAIDKLRAAVRKAQDKTIAAVLKRLKKTRKLTEQHAGVGLTVSLAAPADVRDLTWDEAGGFFFSNESALTCDTLIAVSELGVPTDGVLHLGGTANPNLDEVTVELLGPLTNTFSGGVPTSGAERWGVVFDDVTGVPEGVYAVSATQGTDGPLATGSIGVR